ncbi:MULTISPECIES: hypothetical protein [Pseudomonas syringae group genomosp. 2]|uniref:hypothetical protein n=1 Tax=Pseudomonas syringae group genomosp. 2 TaxID=251698 RepID=UPI0006B9015C|nr:MULTISPECIES: hypothetical protein [Pseudomonas syringae group genomosp. 2]KPB29045.1 Uncharacterized protein AC516_1146 [Pseudomonas amygdali pv. sesami]KPY53499.1 hypothetical protein ALO93_200158 [Pseudomonas amygdali pv. sesami]RMU02093.1 hypothetical protein ALP37_200065 [Pseudomonas amygdali pv. sesami]RMV77953.1 hypothetical protein ALP04_200119 [Pseudomonas amygdali pv. sesami]
MADFFISNVKQVRELELEHEVNRHLQDGWVLLLVRPGVSHERNLETGLWESLPSTEYVLGWIGETEPKTIAQYDQEAY